MIQINVYKIWHNPVPGMGTQSLEICLGIGALQPAESGLPKVIAWDLIAMQTSTCKECQNWLDVDKKQISSSKNIVVQASSAKVTNGVAYGTCQCGSEETEDRPHCRVEENDVQALSVVCNGGYSLKVACPEPQALNLVSF